MGRRKKGKIDIAKTIAFYAVLAVFIAFILSLFNSLVFLANFAIVAGIHVVIYGLLVVYHTAKDKRRRRSQAEYDNDMRLDMAAHHIARAREAEREGDYLGARVSYMQYISALKRTNNQEALEEAKREYALFVRRDPIFNRMLPFFLDVVGQTPGVLQSEITSKAEGMDWDALRYYNRPISKEDIRYVLYFAEEAGLLFRQKKGRSYQLYLPDSIIDNNGNVETTTGKAADTDTGGKHGDKIIANAEMRLALKREESYKQAMASDLHPYLIYRVGNSKKCITEHASRDGLILHKKDPWWNSNFLQDNSAGCTCRISAITEDRLRRYKAEGIPTAPRLDGTGGGTIPVKTVVP